MVIGALILVSSFISFLLGARWGRRVYFEMLMRAAEDHEYVADFLEWRNRGKK